MIRIRPAYGREYEKLGSFGPDLDLFDVLGEDLALLKKKASNNKEAKQVLETTDLEVGDREIEGTVRSGEYGTETTIVDVNTWSVALKKKTHHAEMMPFYFLFDLPDESTEGILLLQRTGIFGVFHVITEVLGESLKRRLPDYRLAINPIIPSGAVEQYVGEGAKMTEIRFIRHSLSSDIANHLSGQSRQKMGRMELVVKLAEADQFPFQSQIRRYMNGKRSLQNLIELDDTKFAYDNVKIRMRSKGTEKLVDLGHPERLRVAFDVTDQVKMEPSGHPTRESMSAAAHDILSDLMAVKHGEE